MSTAKEWWNRNLKRGEKDKKYKKKITYKSKKNIRYGTFCIMDQQLNNKIASLI